MKKRTGSTNTAKNIVKVIAATGAKGKPQRNRYCTPACYERGKEIGRRKCRCICRGRAHGRGEKVADPWRKGPTYNPPPDPGPDQEILPLIG